MLILRLEAGVGKSLVPRFRKGGGKKTEVISYVSKGPCPSIYNDRFRAHLMVKLVVFTLW